jgi:WD40 repeat protein
MRDDEARTIIISRDSYVGDATALLKIDPLVSSSECASGLKRETLLVGVGSSVLWFDPFFADVDDDDDVGDGAGGNEKKRDASSSSAANASSLSRMASKEECLLASCAVALPDGARVHGMRREPSLDDADGNGFGVVVWGGNYASAVALRLPTALGQRLGDRGEGQNDQENASGENESEFSDSSDGVDAFKCEFVVSVGGTFSHWVHDCKVCAPDASGDGYGHHSLAVALSDNSVERWTLPWSVSEFDCAPRCLSVSRCAAESLLYCAALRGETWKRMRVCAGTAFGELLVWFCGRENKQGTHPYASLQGHNGGIMRCHFSEDGKFVVSASEDRTIRVFALPDVSNETKNEGISSSESTNANRNGKGGKDEYDVVFLKCVRASEVIFGHNARCWDCKPLSLNKYGRGSLDVIATTCEDRNVRVFEAPKDKNGFQSVLVNGRDNYTLEAYNENDVNVKKEEIAIATNGTGVTGEDMKASMCFKGFRGKGAWRTCWMRDEKNTLWLIAGGSDGGIKMYDCSQVDAVIDADSDNSAVRTIEKTDSKADHSHGDRMFEDFETVVPPDSGVTPDDIDPDNPNYIKLKKDSEREDYATIVRVIENGMDGTVSVVVGTNHGVLYLFQVESLNLHQERSKKNARLTVLYKPERRSKIITIECLRESNKDEFIFGDATGYLRRAFRCSENAFNVAEKLVFDFPVSKPRLLLQVFHRCEKLYTHEADGTLKRWDLITARTEIEVTMYDNRRVVSLEDGFGFLVVGDQRGGVWVYDSKTLSKVAYEMSAHGNNAVTYVDIRSAFSNRDDTVQFITGGRDGVIRRWTLAIAENGGVRLHEDTKWTSPSKNASQFVLTTKSIAENDLKHVTHVGGFRLSSFAMYSLVLDRELFTFNVGAWKTAHHFIATKTGRNAVFAHCAKAGIVAVKVSKPGIMSVNVEDSKHEDGVAKSLHTWSHGREAHAVAILPPAESDLESNDNDGTSSNAAADKVEDDVDYRMYKDSYNPLCLITGSESGAIHRLSWDRYRPIGARLYDASVVDTLGAGAAVKCISTIQKSRNKHIVVTGGAKNMLAAFSFEWIKHKNNENDWRISTKRLVSQKYVDYAHGRTWSKGVGFVEPKNTADKRVMDISAFAHKRGDDSEVVRCATSGSDGEIAIIELDEVSRKFEKVHATCLNDKPVLSVSTVNIASYSSSMTTTTFLATGSTDGTVAVWDANNLSEPLLVLKETHQSGVNGISLNVYDEKLNLLSLVTGGDDQKVTVSIIKINPTEVAKRCEITLAHESAIRSLWSDGINIVSTGLDQRVHFWDVSFDETASTLTVSKVSTIRAETPEIECIDGYRRPRDGFIELAVCGRGVQTFSSHVHSEFERAIEKFSELSTTTWNAKYGPGFPNVAELLLHVNKRDGEGPKMDSRRVRLFPDNLFREIDVKEEERANQRAYGNKHRPNGEGSKFPFT